MFLFRPLPWEYGVLNLLRRPLRSVLTLFGLTLVILLVLVVVGFIRGLDASLAASGDPRVILIHALGASENIENSSLPGRTAALIDASLKGIQRRQKSSYVSPELFLATRVGMGEASKEDAMTLGLVRGVTPAILLVREQVQLLNGHWPGPGEILVGRLAKTKLGRNADVLTVGRALTVEGRSWRISGHFAAAGSALEAELWCPLEDLQAAMKRQDVSLVSLTLAPGSDFGDIDLFCKETSSSLELEATRESDYYGALQKHYGPIRMLAWSVAVLVALAGVFAGMNTMYGAVIGRVRELAALQAIGFQRRAIVVSLLQEATLLAATAALLAAAIAITFLNGLAVRFTMGAFTLRIDSTAIIVGFCTGLALGVIGVMLPAWRAMRMSITDGLKAV